MRFYTGYVIQITTGKDSLGIKDGTSIQLFGVTGRKTGVHKLRSSGKSGRLELTFLNYTNHFVIVVIYPFVNAAILNVSRLDFSGVIPSSLSIDYVAINNNGQHSCIK